MSRDSVQPSIFAAPSAWLQSHTGIGLQGAVVIFTLMILVAMWGSLASIIAVDTERSIGEVELANSNLARVLEEHTVRNLKSVDDLVLRIKQRVEKDGKSFNLADFYRDAMADSALFINALIVDAHGMAVQGSTPDFSPVYLGDREHVAHHAQRDTGLLFLSKPVFARVAKRWTLVATRRINRPDGSYGGIVGIAIDPYYFTNFYKDVRLGVNGVVALTGRDGIVRARLSDTGAAIGQDVSQGELFRQYAAHESGSLVSTGTVDGIKRVYSYRWARGYPLAVLVGTSFAAAVEDSNARRDNYYFAAAVATLILLCFAGWMISRANRERALNRELTAERRRLGAQHSAILELIEIQSTADFPRFLSELTRVVAKTLDLRRTSVWRLDEQGATLQCVCDYDAEADSHGGGSTLSIDPYPLYFAALRTSRVVTADDAMHDARTAELTADYLMPAGITSLMDVPFQIAGVGRGVLCCEHAGPRRRWNPDDQTFALTAANLVALAYEKAERRLAQAAVKRSEERYRTLFQSSRDAIMTLAPPAWKFTSGNPATLKMFGVRNEAEFVELGPWDLSPDVQPDGQLSADKARQMIALAMRDKSHFFEWTHRRQCGESFPATVLLTQTVQGGEVFLQATVRDVSAQKKAEVELRSSEQRLNLAAEAAGLSLFDWNLTNGQVYLDPQWMKMLGGDAQPTMTDEVALAALVPPEDIPRLREHLVDVLKGRADRYRCEHRVRTPSGDYLWIQSHGAVLERDAEGRAVRIAGFNADISARKRSEAEIKAMNAVLTAKAEELAAVNDELEAFSYSVSHDLRAPLRSILGFGELLMRKSFDQLDGEGRKQLQRILASSERMGHLIDDLLKMAKISRQPMHSRSVDLGKLAGDAIDALRESNPLRQVDVVISPDLTVQADPGLIRVVMDNLIGNAWKFTGKRADARIEMGSMDMDGERTLFVRDNGTGFDMQYAGKLFSPFQRMHTLQQFEGTGVGLATVKRIVERHQGKIWIESAVERGTTVFFRLGGPA